MSGDTARRSACATNPANNPAEILLVEDDPHDVELTLRVLYAEDPHIRVDIVRDGEEALDYLLRRGEWERRPSEHTPNLVVLDLKLPKIGGLQVLEQLKSRPDCAAIPVVVLTSSGEHRDIVESYRRGANSYVQKPVDIAQFRASIRAIASYWLKVSRLPDSPLRRVHPQITPDTGEANSHE
jgi:DNA-binding response OmpR family regulator